MVGNVTLCACLSVLYKFLSGIIYNYFVCNHYNIIYAKGHFRVNSSTKREFFVVFLCAI